ncbi:uncharacterized protein LOC129948431 isoform X2 [Eupeodes corollae]|uniref:uncharacterized protein LOC129948431 isoform X2 n=1 Tax=Eupeodes corollae TaxID=290404 RepID=UPI002490C63E|nr:uncharacterized protein LOC129948431 isoform X2 [Eupeodes corollae]XP_055915410.1 uncharacterized protein LOC129948431 isoform X2 [Eupeodes corollae]
MTTSICGTIMCQKNMISQFPAIFQVTAWIIFFTININLITAKPLGSMMLSEGEIKSICKATTFNIKTTNYSTETLKHEMEEYQKTTNTADISQWNHYGGSIDKKNVEELFKETKPLEVYKNALKEMHEHLLAARNNLNSHLCQHTNDKYMGHTLHIMGLNDSENDLVVSYLESIRRYNELSIVQLEEAHEELRSVPKAEINCTLVPNTGVVAEIITMRKLQATLTYMTNFFNHVEQKFCLGK